MLRESTKEIARHVTECFQDGDIVSHDDLRLLIGLEEPTYDDLDQVPNARRVEIIKERTKSFQFTYLQEVEDLKDCLLKEHKILLKNVRGEGYRLMPPHEQTGEAMSTLKKEVSGSIRKANDVLTNVRIEILDFESRQEHLDAQAKLSFFGKSVNQRLLA